MLPEPKPPLSVAIARRMVRAASWLVPRAVREGWLKEWEAEIWHRWRFLTDVGAWSLEEGFRLLLCCCGSVADAAWHFRSQQAVDERIQRCARSPWVCLAALLSPLSVLGLITGFPATRQLLMPLPYPDASQLSVISLHSYTTGKETGVRASMLPEWRDESTLLSPDRLSITPFNWMELKHDFPDTSLKPLLVSVEPAFFKVLGVHVEQGAVPTATALLLSHRAWVSLFHSNPRLIGGSVTLQGQAYPVAGILPEHFWFLSRRPVIFFVMPHLPDNRVMALARSKPGVASAALEKELTSICRKDGFSVSASRPHVVSLYDALTAPVYSFAIALIGGLVCLARLGRLRDAIRRDLRVGVARRLGFFVAKCTIALSLVFCAGLELSRGEASILLPRLDSASGPGLAWLYLLCAMAVFLWAKADQSARCRVCLRLLCFPVRIGSPGRLLLDWAGTELLCTEGHGVLHVPDMVVSWDNQADHWIALDDSWRDCFTHAD
jgi:MacB-like periplasmic core domain